MVIPSRKGEMEIRVLQKEKSWSNGLGAEGQAPVEVLQKEIREIRV